MKKIALPVINNTLSPHFGNCTQFKVYYVENRAIVKEDLISAPPHQPGSFPNWLADKGVSDVITGGIGLKAIEIFNQHKINVFVGVKVKDTKELVQDYIDGILETDGNLCNH
ncbi:MAG: ATPase [Bacteroidales bacterium]|nr:ATPase [Bacteroidales bacterium]